MGVGSGGRGAFSPLDFEIISIKRLFFQFRKVKNKFHHFWPLPGKNPSDAHVLQIGKCTPRGSCIPG